MDRIRGHAQHRAALGGKPYRTGALTLSYNAELNLTTWGHNVAMGQTTAKVTAVKWNGMFEKHVCFENRE